MEESVNGGDRVADVIRTHGVQFLFTLCGGHISPILVGCKKNGIRVIDVRHEATAVFAADAVARLTGIPGVAAVTAGPGATNTITAVKNAQLAQSPLILLGGAAATALQGRGALQDIGQLALFKPHVKWATSVRRVRHITPVLVRAFEISCKDVPGPVFVELPIDLLYDETLVRNWYGVNTGGGRSLSAKAMQYYLRRHLNCLFAGADEVPSASPRTVEHGKPSLNRVHRVAKKLDNARQPLMLVGSQALLNAPKANQVADALNRLNIPVFLSGMARGLLGKAHQLQLRHKRRQALKDADLVILAGVPNDFRLDYGRHIRKSTYLISVNRSRRDLKMNRRPNLGIHADVGDFLVRLANELFSHQGWPEWLEKLRKRDRERETEIREQSKLDTGLINPLHLLEEIEKNLSDESVFIADGGDFVATASYIVRPPKPLSWLDPGVFGTLGVGAGFALGAKLCRPEANVRILYGDGSVAYSLAEFDTFVRHRLPVMAVVGNDACWTQIARAQVDILKDEVGTELAHRDYHIAAEGYGGKGYLLKQQDKIGQVLESATHTMANGIPVLINAHIGNTDFRRGSISM